MSIQHSISQRQAHTSFKQGTDRLRGMRLKEYRNRQNRTTAEKLGSKAHSDKMCAWQNVLAVGLNTSGPLSGLRASSFNNPPMGPPLKLFGRNRRRHDTRLGLSIGVLDMKFARLRFYILQHFFKRVIICTPSCTKFDGICQ